MSAPSEDRQEESSAGPAARVYQRAYKACESCRKRKNKCVFSDGVSPPCDRCIRSGRECLVTPDGRRGRPRTKKPDLDTSTRSQAMDTTVQESARQSAGPSSHSFGQTANANESLAFEQQSLTSDNSPEAEELKNPDDALSILCQVAGEAPSRAQSPTPASATGSSGNMPPPAAKNVPQLEQVCNLVIEGYLSSEKLLQLVDAFVAVYHPFYPLLATAKLARSCISQFATEEPILLAVICTIATRNDSDLQLHRRLFEYSRQLLTSSMWGLKTTIGAIEALLLLSEWVGPSSFPIGERIKEASVTWLLVGSAVRLGYLHGLDQTSFEGNGTGSASSNSAARRRLAWACCYWSDRSISIRMGRGFWTRGPGPGATQHKGNFPTLSAKNQLDSSDYAGLMQAHLDLIQLMANVQDVLYSSKERQLQISVRGDYPRYLDDFSQGIELWSREWKHQPWSSPARETLSFSYQYLVLYVNSFAFSATLLRAQRNGQTPGQLFANGLGLLADYRFIRNAMESARSLVNEYLDSIDSQPVIQYMAPRFYLYIIYASVFLLKAVRVGALKATEASDVGIMTTKLIGVWTDPNKPQPEPADRYAKLLEAYMLRVGLRRSAQTITQPAVPNSSSTAFIPPYEDVINIPIQPFSPLDLNDMYNNQAAPMLFPGNTFAQDDSAFFAMAEWATHIDSGMGGLPSFTASESFGADCNFDMPNSFFDQNGMMGATGR